MSKSYLQEQHMPYLTQRAMWEITHELGKTSPSVSYLNLNGNSLLPRESLLYLKKLPSLTRIDISNTNLAIEDLVQFQLAHLLLPTSNGQHN